MELTEEQAKQVSTTTTESVDPRYADLDLMSAEEIVTAMNKADEEVPRAIARQVPRISAAIDAISSGMSRGGRLFYVGAGTSGRLGVLDASECPPTFSSDPSQVVGIIAGGDDALRNAIEGAEDDYQAGYEAIQQFELCANDSVVGIAASGRTPYVLGAVASGAVAGAITVGISNNAGAALSDAVDYPIEVVVGPEVLSGSTRLKSGSAQKQVLNMISTASMVLLGKTYGNLMVDVSATNQKLLVRARNLVMRITGCEQEAAEDALKLANGSVKVACVSLIRQVDTEQARKQLAESGGVMRKALEI